MSPAARMDGAVPFASEPVSASELSHFILDRQNGNKTWNVQMLHQNNNLQMEAIIGVQPTPRFNLLILKTSWRPEQNTYSNNPCNFLPKTFSSNFSTCGVTQISSKACQLGWKIKYSATGCSIFRRLVEIKKCIFLKRRKMFNISCGNGP